MREIKFRAILTEWDDPTYDGGFVHGSVLLRGGAYYMFTGAYGNDFDSCEHGWNWACIKEGTLGQFTGLKDKNGREIYEGDIFKDEFGEVGAIVYTSEDVGSCGCCYQDFEGIGFKAPSVRINSKGEVVGNVHVHDATKGTE